MLEEKEAIEVLKYSLLKKKYKNFKSNKILTVVNEWI